MKLDFTFNELTLMARSLRAECDELRRLWGSEEAARETVGIASAEASRQAHLAEADVIEALADRVQRACGARS